MWLGRPTEKATKSAHRLSRCRGCTLCWHQPSLHHYTWASSRCRKRASSSVAKYVGATERLHVWFCRRGHRPWRSPPIAVHSTAHVSYDKCKHLWKDSLGSVKGARRQRREQLSAMAGGGRVMTRPFRVIGLRRQAISVGGVQPGVRPISAVACRPFNLICVYVLINN